MVRRRLSLRLVASCLTLGLAALPTSAAASGFQLVEQNASGLGSAYAGQAAGVEDASAIFFNPAALTNVKGWNVALSVEPIGINTTFTDTGTTNPSLGGLTFPVAAGNDGGNAGKWIPVPSGYVSGQVHDRVWIGVGFNVPFGLETDWDPAWVGRFHATKSKVQTWNLNPTVAVQVLDKLSLGVGVDYQHLSADFNQVVAYGGISYASAFSLGGAAAAAGIAGQIPGGPAAESPVLVSGSSNGWGWNAGAFLRVTEQAQVGVSYRSKVKHDITGDVAFQDVATFSTNAALGPLAALGAGLNAKFADGPIAASIELPDTVSVAGSWSKDRLKLLADWTYTHWSTIGALDINRDTSPATAFSSVPLNFRNTWRAGVGASWKVNDVFTARVGTAYDKSPVEEQYRTPRLPDKDRVWAAAGFQWKYGSRFRLDGGYAHLFVSDAASNLPNQAAPTAAIPVATPQGALVGSYATKVDIVGVQATLAF